MINTLRAFCAAALMLAAAISHAAPATVYDNTTVDQQFSVFYSTGYTQIGDRVQLAGASQVTRLDAQFYNAGGDAVFDAILGFYSTDGAAPGLIGSAFTVSGLSIGSGASLTASFADLGGLALPADVIVALSIQMVSGNGDIGLNFFDAPSVGSSDAETFYADDGSGLVQATTLLGIDNLYLHIEGTPLTVPEPASMALVLLALGALALRQRRAAARQAC